MKKKSFIFFLLLFTTLQAQFVSISALYKTLPSSSILKHLTFYQLYPDAEEGQMALKEAWALLCQENPSCQKDFLFPQIDISSIIQIVNKTPDFEIANLKEQDLQIIEKLSSHLNNRKLKTHNCWDEKDFINAAPEDIDITRGLFVAELGSTAEARKKIRYYEAYIDLMALQILAMLPKDCTDLDKIKYLNEFIFFEMGFRFPPLSSYSKDIDSFTFLPSVIDKRKGVCLGISILYLCLAQRINLSLEAITPPGHIFVRHTTQEGQVINIETTARGINVSSEEYLNIETKSLQKRNNKEVIGLAFINQASMHLKENGFEKAATLYKTAQKYLTDDFLLKQLLGICYLFTNKEKEGKKLLEEIKDFTPSYHIGKDHLASDYLAKKVDIKGLKSIFIPWEDTREELLAKKNELEQILKKFPEFRMGLLTLSNVWLQLGRTKEAKEVLNKYYHYDKNNPVVNFYLAILSFERFDYPSSWKYLFQAEHLLEKEDYNPKMVQEFKEALTKTCLYNSAHK